jgi:oxygen-independent coproporphyrinogen-3 oxidase
VREIIDDYIKMDGDDFEWANYGFRLDEREQRRRYVIQSILQAEGLDLERYQGWFGWSALEDIPSLAELEELGLGEITDGHLRLNAEGLRWSDVIGPWLESPAVRERMVGYELR